MLEAERQRAGPRAGGHELRIVGTVRLAGDHPLVLDAGGRDHAERHYDRDIRKAERKYDRDVRKAERKYRAAAYHRPPGYQYRHWNRGDRLPPAYRADRYRITNYSYYRLPPPPRGYYYTRVDNDVVLTAAATGLIASVIVNMFQ